MRFKCPCESTHLSSGQLHSLRCTNTPELADNALRTQARESADMGRRLDSSFRPNTAVFSPRFITFFLAPPGSAR